VIDRLNEDVRFCSETIDVLAEKSSGEELDRRVIFDDSGRIPYRSSALSDLYFFFPIIVLSRHRGWFAAYDIRGSVTVSFGVCPYNIDQG
jgi:hypothetical protein